MGPAPLISEDQGPIHNPFDCLLVPAVPADIGGTAASETPPGTSTPAIRPVTDPFRDLPEGLQVLIDQAIAACVAAAFQGHRSESVVFESFSYGRISPSASLTGPHSPDAARGSEDFTLGEELHSDFSDDDGVFPDTPAFTGLFPPNRFRSLLHKARTTASLKEDECPRKCRIPSRVNATVFSRSRR